MYSGLDYVGIVSVVNSCLTPQLISNPTPPGDTIDSGLDMWGGGGVGGKSVREQDKRDVHVEGGDVADCKTIPGMHIGQPDRRANNTRKRCDKKRFSVQKREQARGTIRKPATFASCFIAGRKPPTPLELATWCLSSSNMSGASASLT